MRVVRETDANHEALDTARDRELWTDDVSDLDLVHPAQHDRKKT